jgi:hypothetical protein
MKGASPEATGLTVTVTVPPQLLARADEVIK